MHRVGAPCGSPQFGPEAPQPDPVAAENIGAGLDDLDRKARAILGAAAIVVGAPIGELAQELIRQITVGAVDFHAVKAGALRINPDDAVRVGVVDGGRARISTRRGSADVTVELSDRMQPGHVSLPNGLNDGRTVAWLFESGPRVLVVALLTYVLLRAIALGTRRWEERLGRDGGVDEVERAKRARTVGSLVRNVLIVLVSSLAALTILGELGVDIMPVVTGAGILGLAVGFGAQTLVRDVISGFFLIFENHLRVGDVAEIEGTGGIVEAINLRTTVLRDLEGTVHVFPNGSFSRVSNRTKEFSYYVVDVGVAYKEDTDRVCEVLRAVAEDLQRDPAYSPSILAPLEVLGVDAFADSQVTIKVRIKTIPLKQWEVGRELRRRIKQAFDRHGIEIPFPHLSVYFGEASRPWRTESVDARTGSSPQPADGRPAPSPGDLS